MRARTNEVTVVRARAKPLSPREIEVMAKVAGGLVSKEIAKELGISPQTIKNYIYSAMHKLGATTRANAVAILLLGEEWRKT